MKFGVCLVAVCFLIFCCPSADGQTPKKNDQSAEWEYKTFYFVSDELLNHYGKVGRLRLYALLTRTRLKLSALGS